MSGKIVPSGDSQSGNYVELKTRTGSGSSGGTVGSELEFFDEISLSSPPPSPPKAPERYYDHRYDYAPLIDQEAEMKANKKCCPCTIM